MFFESDGTLVNSGLRGGVISLLQQRYGKHIKFFWCLSHRIELGLEDALKKDMEEVDTAMRDLYYIYQNSGKCLRELRSLHEILKDVYIALRMERSSLPNPWEPAGLTTSYEQ